MKAKKFSVGDVVTHELRDNRFYLVFGFKDGDVLIQRLRARDGDIVIDKDTRLRKILALEKGHLAHPEQLTLYFYRKAWPKEIIDRDIKELRENMAWEKAIKKGKIVMNYEEE